MFNSAAGASGMKGVVMMLMVLGTRLEAAPADRGLAKTLPSLTHTPTIPEKSSALSPTQYLKHLLLSTKAAGLDGAARITDKTTTKTITAGVRAARQRANTETVSPERRAQMLKMISALEELHRTFNSTLSSRITIMQRASVRNSGRKNKVLPAADGGGKPTTAPPAAADSTVSRASADVFIPSLTGRNFKKSLPPQTKKTNKRVCFWKYCSQN